MSDQELIKAETRTEFGKGAARRIRRADKVPAVLYGHGTDPKHISLPGHETMMALKHGGANALLELDIEGQAQLALTKQVQIDPIRRTIEHIDFVAVRRGEKVTVDVPVHLHGDAAPETLVVTEHATVQIEAEATAIPERIEISIEGAEVGTQILAGALKPSSGTVTAGRVGWVPQQPALYSKLSVAENLRLFARLERAKPGYRRHGWRRPWSRGRRDEGPGNSALDVERAVAGMLEQTALADRAGDETGKLSGGNQQRVNIAIGLLGEPGVLLLDEPSAALDPRQRERLWEFVGALARGGTTVIFTTHNVGEAERYAARVLVLADGELLFTGSPDHLHRTVGEQQRDFEAAFVRFLHERGH